MPIENQSPQTGNHDQPGQHPPEIQPNEGDFDQPDRTPPEIIPAGGDTDVPDVAPAETPVEPIAPGVPPPD